MIGGILLLLLVISTFHEGVDVTQVFPALAGDLTFAALLVACTLIFGLYGIVGGPGRRRSLRRSCRLLEQDNLDYSGDAR